MRTEEEIKKRGRYYTEWLKNSEGITQYVLEEVIGELVWFLNKKYEPKIVYKEYGDSVWLCLAHYILYKKRKPSPCVKRIVPRGDDQVVCAFCKFE